MANRLPHAIEGRLLAYTDNVDIRTQESAGSVSVLAVAYSSGYCRVGATGESLPYLGV